MAGTLVERVITASLVFSVAGTAGLFARKAAAAALFGYLLYTAAFNLWLVLSGRRLTLGVSPVPAFLLLILPPTPTLVPRFLPGALVCTSICYLVGWERIEPLLLVVGAQPLRGLQFANLSLPFVAPILGVLIGASLWVAERQLPDVYNVPQWRSVLIDPGSRRKLKVIRHAGDIRRWKPGGSLSALDDIDRFRLDKDWRVRAYAAHVLGERPSISLAEVLRPFLEDGDWRVRLMAAKAIGQAFGGPNRDWLSRHGGWSNADIEHSTTEARQVLQTALSNPDARVAAEAKVALRQVES